MRTLIKNAKILTMDDNFAEYETGDILIEGTKISSIGKNLAVTDDGNWHCYVTKEDGTATFPASHTAVLDGVDVTATNDEGSSIAINTADNGNVTLGVIEILGKSGLMTSMMNIH